MQIPFVGGAYEGRTRRGNPQEAINCYVETDKTGGKPMALVGTPGLTKWASLQLDFVGRGLYAATDGNLYAVNNNQVYKLSTNASQSVVGELTTDTGFVSMADNGDELIVIDGTAQVGYIYDFSAGTFTQISDSDFPECSQVAYIDGYFVVFEDDTQSIQWSNLRDGTTWDASDTANAEGAQDDIVAIFANHRDLWIFGTESTEVFENTGDATTPFQRIPGAFVEMGCASQTSVSKLGPSMFWLSRNRDGHGQVMMSQGGYTGRIISTPQIEYQIAQYSKIDDAIGYTYQQQGHSFYVLTFPVANETWCYDVTTQYWHKRASYPSQSRHRAIAHAFFDNKNMVLDYENGLIYYYDYDSFYENGEELIMERVTQPVDAERKRLYVSRLELDFEPGVGTQTGQGETPEVILEVSRDGGFTYGNRLRTSLGAVGKYGARAVWRRLGEGRNFAFRVTISDPVQRVITGAVADVTASEGY